MSDFLDDHSYMMPAHFGGRPGGMGSTTYFDTTTAMIRYRTDEAALARFLPPGFSLRAPEVMLAAINNRGVEWMAGEHYNILAVNVPARFSGESGDVDGWYSLVVWENKTAPILTGREQTGVPKIFSEVEDFRFLHGEMRTWCHHGGHSFCDLHFSAIRDADADERRAVEAEFTSMDWMAWRYIPRVGPAGGADLSHATLYPQEFDVSRVRMAEAEFSWSIPPFHKNPNQVHIIAQLAELPNHGPAAPGVIVDSAAILRGDLARRLD